MSAQEEGAAPGPQGGARGWWKSPALHFLALGALMFALSAALPDPAPDPLRVTADDVARLDREWEVQMGRPATPREREALLRGEIDDRLLLEQAYAHGLERTDPLVQRRLIQNQRFLDPDDPASDAEMLERAYAVGLDRSDRIVRRRLIERIRMAIFEGARQQEPSREALANFMAENSSRFAQPSTVRLTHVYLARDRRQAALAEDARALGEKLIAESVRPEDAREHSDPSLWPLTLHTSEARLAQQFGGDFAAAALAARAGTWTGPHASPYGLHWIYVHEVSPGRQPTLEEALQEVRNAYRSAEERRALREALDAYRAVRSVEIEPPDER